MIANELHLENKLEKRGFLIFQLSMTLLLKCIEITSVPLGCSLSYHLLAAKQLCVITVMIRSVCFPQMMRLCLSMY